MVEERYLVHADGGSRGNPGPAAIGVKIADQAGHVLGTISKQIGITTNNVAEYTAVLAALNWLVQATKNRPIKPNCDFYLDSSLIVNQLNGRYKIKERRLQQLALKIKELEKDYGGVCHYRHIPRGQNTEADSLVNQSFCKPL